MSETTDGIDLVNFMSEVLANWTEADVDARRASFEAHFAPDAVFVDPDGTFTGIAGLESFSDSLRGRRPDARFSLRKDPQRTGDAVRAFWQVGPPDQPDKVSGMDMVILDGAVISRLYVFLDAPAGS
jgi:hypothetical protein